MTRVTIIGAGPGDEKHLTMEARQRIMTADTVITTGRLHDALSRLNPNTLRKSLADIPGAARNAAADGSVAVLVSGDSGFHSLGKTLPALLRDEAGGSGFTVEFLSGISSMQYLCAKLGEAYDDAKTVSLHGRDNDIVPFASYNPKVFALTGGTVKAHDAISRLVAAGLGHVTVSVGADLGSPGERLVTGRAKNLAGETFPDLACMLVLNPDSRAPHERIPDSAFIRGKTPMTKEAVRTFGIAALGIRPGDTVIDIGAGTGSVSVCMARKAFEGVVYAVERDDEALALLAQNRLAFGAFNMHIVKAAAPLGLDGLPAPDKAFIGGSGGRLRDIMRALFAKNESIRAVVAAVTLETLHQAVAAFEERGIEPEIMCVNAAVAQKTGPYRMMKAENPVHLVCGANHAD